MAARKTPAKKTALPKKTPAKKTALPKKTPAKKAAAPKKTPAKKAAAAKKTRAAKAASTPRKTAAAPTVTAQRTTAAPQRLLSGGNPQVAKADGDAPVQAYIAAIPGWKRDIGRRLDALVTRAVPGVVKAVKWNSPFYGVEGKGWFLSFHVFTNYVKVTFFKGTSLTPPPAGGSAKEARWIDVHEHDLDEAQLTRWIRQAAKIPGWSGGIGG